MKQNQCWGRGLSPFFIPEDFLPTYRAVGENAETEILIIGAGLSGLMCAYELLKDGKDVTVVTANTVGDGACRYSAGILSADGGPDLLRLKELLGTEKAVAWYRFALAAVKQAEKVVADTGSKCDFEKKPQFYYTAHPRETHILKEEYYTRLHLGADCRWISPQEGREMFSFPLEGGIFTEGGAQLNAVKFCRDLADWITLHGGKIYEGSRVDVIESVAQDKFQCRCGNFTLTSKQVVDARGGEVLAKRPQLGQRVTVFSVVTEPVSSFRGWPDACLIKSHDTLSYLRTTPDRRIVFSGQATANVSPSGRVGKMDAEALCRIKYRNLTSELKEMFFGIPRIKQESGFTQGLVLPKKGLPYVGRDPQWKGLYYLYAFGENGIAGALMGSAWIRAAICEKNAKIPGFLSL